MDRYEGLGASDVGPIVVDIETAPLPDAEVYLDPVVAAKNLKDPEKIRADIEQRTADRADRLALDWNVGRIVALGWWTDRHGCVASVCQDDHAEQAALVDFWRVAKHRLVLGFNVKNFDGPYLVQRSRYLGVVPLQLDLGRYSRKGVIDLMNELTFNDAPAANCMRRSLHAFCRRFGIPVDDPVTGSDVPALVARGEWEAVRAHVMSDVMLTVRLAQRLGFVRVRETS
jgi:predicted PolB exonuclease-like 3'-5' exonuclease